MVLFSSVFLCGLLVERFPITRDLGAYGGDLCSWWLICGRGGLYVVRWLSEKQAPQMNTDEH
jgi:hypothetical protein